jgi:hypothetical protein
MNIEQNRSFFNYYILFPMDTNSKRERQNNLIKSIAIGIFTLGIAHAICGLVYLARSLKNRATITPPIIQQPIIEQQKRDNIIETPVIDSPRATPAPSSIEQPAKTPVNKEDDDLGTLIDNFLTNPDVKGLQTKLNKAIRNKACPFTFHEKQLAGGQCGRHAINNAFGREIEGDDYVSKVEKFVGFEMSKDDFGTDPEQLKAILQSHNVETKREQIEKLPDYTESKSLAIQNYIGEAKWLIISNTTHHPIPMPSKSAATYPMAAGHFIAARKDDQGQWWIIDSRTPWMLDAPLTVIFKECTLIVPV